MATQTIAKQTTQVERPALVGKIGDFLCSVGELLDSYFSGPMRLDILDEKYRARLTAYEKVEIDRDLHRM